MYLSPRRPGFTLIELMVVIAIVLVSAGLLLSAVQKVREASLGAHCTNNLRQLGVACHHVNQTYRRMPSAWNWFPAINAEGGGAGIGPLFFHLLPFIEEQNLYESSRHQKRSPAQNYFDYGRNVNVRQVPLFNCPLDPTLPTEGGAPEVTPFAASSYAANFLVFGQVDRNFTYVDPFAYPQLELSFADGTSNTILFAEKYAVVRGNGTLSAGGCHWDYWGKNVYAPFFALYDPKWTDQNAVGPVRKPAGDTRDSRFQLRPPIGSVNASLCATAHSGGMNVCIADGSVRTLAAGMDKYVWWSLVTPAGGD